VKANDRAAVGRVEEARKLGIASLAVSLTGIALGFAIIFIIAVTVPNSNNSNS